MLCSKYLLDNKKRTYCMLYNKECAYCVWFTEGSNRSHFVAGMRKTAATTIFVVVQLVLQLRFTLNCIFLLQNSSVLVLPERRQAMLKTRNLATNCTADHRVCCVSLWSEQRIKLPSGKV